MKSIVGKIILPAALLLTPLLSHGQNIASKTGIVSRDVERYTLLTGPHLLSPPHGKQAVSREKDQVTDAMFVPAFNSPAPVTESFRFVPGKKNSGAKVPGSISAVPPSGAPKPETSAPNPSPASLRFNATVPPSPTTLKP